MKKPYEAILFDFDGVLVDSEPIHWECWQEILKPFGIPLDWEHYSENCIGISDRQMVAFLCEQIQPPADFDQVYAEYPRKRAMFRDRMEKVNALPNAVRELVAGVHREYKTAVVTSSGRMEIEPILERAGLLSHLDTCVYGGDVKQLKPAPEPYLLAASRLGVESALVVEDSEAGETSGRAAGFDVLRISCQSELIGSLNAALNNNRREPSQRAASEREA